MEIRILHQMEGARQAEGLTVVIDVFRAFSVECFLSEMHVAHIHPVGTVEECRALKAAHPDWFLVGERGGVPLEGFDAGNSPSQLVLGPPLAGRTVVHTTSAGVQGITLAVHATEVLTGSLLNARAIARYIRQRNPRIVSLVCMGLNGKEDTAEDVVCAEYIRDLVEGREPSIHRQIADLKRTSGHKFFVKGDGKSFPEPDFFMCLVPDVFDFVLRVDRDSRPFESIRVDV